MDIGDEAAVKEGSEEVARPPLNPYYCSSEHGRGDPWSAIGRVWEGDWKGIGKRGVIYQVPLLLAGQLGEKWKM